jgi:hypothetical protein
MSYSYIKSVYPNFENSSSRFEETNVYEEPLFLDKTAGTKSNQVSASNYEETKSNEGILKQSSNLYQHKKNLQNEKDKGNDNLKFYNLPAPSDFYHNLSSFNSNKGATLGKDINTIEKFDQSENSCKDLDCDMMMKHVSECNKCKNVFLKQFGLENDRIRNEEMMELVSYLIFGLFMLMLLDAMKNK